MCKRNSGDFTMDRGISCWISIGINIQIVTEEDTRRDLYNKNKTFFNSTRINIYNKHYH